MRTAILIIFGVFAAVASAVGAEPALTTDRAQRFAATLPAVAALGKALEENGDADLFKADYDLKEGEAFLPYSYALPRLKQIDAGAFAALNKIAQDHKFKDAADWAHAGDRTMLAYIAAKTPPEMAAMASMMTPQMLSMMPADAQAQYKKSMQVVQAINAVSQADKDAIAPITDLLDASLVAAGQDAFARMPSRP